MPSTLTSAGWVVDPEPPKSGGGGVTVLPAATTLALDAPGKKLYMPYTVTGPITINITGAEPGAEAEMVVIGNGTHKPTIVGADPVISNFDFVLQGRNFLNAWHDGDGRRYAWSQLEVNSAPSPAPAPPAPAPSPAPSPSPSPSPAPAPGGEDAITVAYRAKAATAGVTLNETHVGYADVLAKAMRSAGIHTKVTRMGLAINDSLSASLVPFIGDTNDTTYNTVSFDPALGWGTNGSSAIVTAAQATAGNGGMGAYLRTSQAIDTTARGLMGTGSASDAYRIVGNRTPGLGSAGAANGHVSNLHGTLVGHAGVTSGGLVAGAWTEVRRSESNTELFFNGASVNLSTGTTITGAADVPASAPISVMGINSSATGVPASFLASGSRVAAYWIVDGTWSVSDEAALHTAMQAFQTSMGRQV